MGLRLRLRADYDVSAVTGQSRVIVDALKKYGMILADNGTSWFISGTSDPRWDLDDLNQLKRIPGTAFEAVYTGPIKRTPEVSSVRDEYREPHERVHDLPALTAIVVDGTIELSFTLPSASHVSLTLTDARGEVVASILDEPRNGGVSVARIGTASLPSGMYFCRMTTAEGTSMARVAVVR
jgi:hypothetical protein